MTDTPTYDYLAYDSVAFAETHPSRLGGVAWLSGFPAPPPQTARVLELGCASGGNLIPMAASLPQAKFTGVDYSSNQIDTGQQSVTSLRLPNCELIRSDIATMSLTGEFDYIIAHGVYSWIKEDVRDVLMQICSRHLAPYGVAYISFNALPGWTFRTVVRDFMQFHGRGIEDNARLLELARSGFDQLAGSVNAENPIYQQLIKQEAEQLRAHNDSYLLHEHLEPTNQAFYIRDFVQHANEHDLAYLCEARLRGHPKDHLTAMDLPDDLPRVEQEQYSDFISGRQFRRSILRRRQDPVDTCDLNQLKFTALDRLEVSEHSSGGAVIGFAKGKLTVGPGLACNLLKRFADIWPESLSVEQLADLEDTSKVLMEVNKLALAGVLVAELGSANTSLRTVSAKPEATRTCRYQAKNGLTVTNRRHENVELSIFQRNLLSRLDGSQTHRKLAKWVSGLIAKGTISVEGPTRGRQMTERLVASQLQDLAILGLLK
jgi:methyltransferase-like protein/trans-aconitate methyltransferase